MIRPFASAVALLLTATSITAAAGPVAAQATPGYEPLPSPQRLLDTRPGQPTVDGRLAGIGKRTAGSRTVVDVAGRAGLESDLGSVVLNVTVDQPDDFGFVTVWPCDRPQPTASNVNHVPGQVVGVAAISRVAGDGTICLFTRAAAHLIVDVGGHFPRGTFEPLAAPERLADTRPGEPTVDGAFRGDGRPAARGVYRVQVAGRGSVPAGARAAALTVTATDVGQPGFLTVFPCDVARPNASNVNYAPGLTTPNAVITRLDASGAVCVFTLQPVHLVVDVAGSIAAPFFEALPEPRRLLDTRPGEPTIDGLFAGGGRQPQGSTLQLDVAGRAGIPAGATAVVLNVTSTASIAPGFVTVHPEGSRRPEASNLNYVGGATVANMVVAALGPDGDACLFNLGATDLVVDVAGWLTGPALPAAAAACPGRTPDEGATAYRNTLVRRPVLHRTVGVDRIALYICRIPGDSRVFDGSRQHDTTADEFAALLRDEVAPYYAQASGGSYTTEFTARGEFAVGRDDGPGECLDEAQRRTGNPFTNVLVAGSTLTGGGFASPGSIFIGPGAPDTTVFELPPSQSGRGGWLGGSTISTFPNPATIVHEIGHTLHWPHSFIGPESEYDNPVDVMSGGDGPCTSGSFTYTCDPANTLAFNRLASGWLRSGQVVTHPSGTVNYRLDPPGTSGLQLVALPDPGDPLTSLTVEARPAVGNDDFFTTDGVTLHLVDQVDVAGETEHPRLSSGRFQRQAVGEPNGFDHVIGVGERLTVRGVTVEVLARVGDRYDVRITGSYDAPAGSFFTTSARRSSAAPTPGSGLTDAIGTRVAPDRRTSCATLPIDEAFAAGCTR